MNTNENHQIIRNKGKDSLVLSAQVDAAKNISTMEQSDIKINFLYNLYTKLEAQNQIASNRIEHNKKLIEQLYCQLHNYQNQQNCSQPNTKLSSTTNNQSQEGPRFRESSKSQKGFSSQVVSNSQQGQSFQKTSQEGSGSQQGLGSHGCLDSQKCSSNQQIQAQQLNSQEMSNEKSGSSGFYSGSQNSSCNMDQHQESQESGYKMNAINSASGFFDSSCQQQPLQFNHSEENSLTKKCNSDRPQF